VNYSFALWSLAGLCASFNSLPVHAAEYCLGPYKGNTVICCSTPAGWLGWKDDPHLRDRMKQSDEYTRAWLGTFVDFHQPNWKQGAEGPYLGLDTRGRDSRGQPDVQAGLRDFLNESEQLQDLSPRRPPCVVVSRFGSFHTENYGTLKIWRIRCPSGRQHLLTLLAQRDVLVRISLDGPDIKDIVPKLDSLKELARSVRITDASLAVPDVIKIDAARLSDDAVRKQLLQFTPLGTPREKVYDCLQRPRLPEELHWENGDLWTQIGSYSSLSRRRERPKEYRPPTEEEIRSQISTHPNLPRTTTVKAYWKFDKERKLRDIEIKREVVEVKPKQ
jgi:hypothetical protein